MVSQLVKIEKQGPYTVYIIEDRVVVAVGHFAGKNVRGIAKCSPNDKFDEELGVRLAVLRCAIKIEKKRRDWAEKRYKEAAAAMEKANRHFNNMVDYLHNSEETLASLKAEFTDVMEDIG